MLLYRVGDCVMHLCPICNRRTRNVLDDELLKSQNATESASTTSNKSEYTVVLKSNSKLGSIFNIWHLDIHLVGTGHVDLVVIMLVARP